MDEGSEEEGGAEAGSAALSAHARATARMARKLSKLEQEQLAEKPWQLKGEVGASKRPRNSLLEADLDFDQGSKAAPVITEEVTASLEEVIKARIKDSVFDDVVRKAALKPQQYRPKAAEISNEKSKLGLGEEYAKEYEELVLGHTPAEQAKVLGKHADVRAVFAKLGQRLDALFNFHAVPRPFKAEATVRAASVSAIQMEEAIPTAMADHQTRAPEEVYGVKRGNALTTRAELSQAERKAERRKKKRVRKRKTAERDHDDDLRAKLNPHSEAAKRVQAKKDEKLLADAKRKGTVVDGAAGGKGGGKGGGVGGGAAEGGARAGSQYTRSAQFFKNLQQAPAKRGAPDDGDAGGANKAARFKL